MLTLTECQALFQVLSISLNPHNGSIKHDAHFTPYVYEETKAQRGNLPKLEWSQNANPGTTLPAPFCSATCTCPCAGNFTGTVCPGPPNNHEVGVLHLPGQEADRGYVTCPGLHSEPRCKPSSLTPKPRNQVLSVVNPWPLKPRGSKAAPNRSSTDCGPLSSCHPASAMHTSQEGMPWADSPWDGPGGPTLVRQEPEMQMNSPTQQPHSLCQCETGFARGKKKNVHL